MSEANNQPLRRPHGIIVVDGREVADTIQCPHCDTHFVIVKGSGKERGWCPKCHAVTCGDPRCMICVPFEEKLNYMEGRYTPYADVIRALELGWIPTGP